jgi:hypothetical protein
MIETDSSNNIIRTPFPSLMVRLTRERIPDHFRDNDGAPHFVTILTEELMLRRTYNADRALGLLGLIQS